MRPTILTYSGLYFDLAHPTPEMVRIEDVAHALGHCARYAGHTITFYSVAQHSVLASMIVPYEHALQALLHDAAEAYVGDMTSPLKKLVPQFRAVEERVWAAIAGRFGIPAELHPEVKRADLVLLATEQRDLMPPHDDEWALCAGVKPLSITIEPLAPTIVQEIFLERYRALTWHRSAEAAA